MTLCQRYSFILLYLSNERLPRQWWKTFSQCTLTQEINRLCLFLSWNCKARKKCMGLFIYCFNKLNQPSFLFWLFVISVPRWNCCSFSFVFRNILCFLVELELHFTAGDSLNTAVVTRKFCQAVEHNKRDTSEMSLFRNKQVSYPVAHDIFQIKEVWKPSVRFRNTSKSL